MKKILVSLFAMALFICIPENAKAATVIFSDNFDGPAVNPAWGNEIGDWTITNGGYHAFDPSMDSVSRLNIPNNYSDYLVNFNITTPSIENYKGSIFVNSPSIGNGIAFTIDGDDLYWNILENGNWGEKLNKVTLPGSALNDPIYKNPYIRISVMPNRYVASIQGSMISYLETDKFSSGQVALSGYHTYDNFVFTGLALNSTVPTPEPSSMVLGLISLAGILAKKRKEN